MAECDLLTENLPLLLTESLDPSQRELTHQHIESCAACSDEWSAYKDTWSLLQQLPEVPLPNDVATYADPTSPTGLRLNASILAPRGQRPKFEPSRRQLTWPSGAQATLYSAGEPESLRGPQHSHACRPSPERGLRQRNHCPD